LDSSYAVPRDYRYRDLGWLTRWLGRALLLDVAVSVIVLIARLGAPFLAPVAKAAALLTNIWFLPFLAGVVLFLVWIYFAANNVHVFGADVTFEPSGAIGWLLTPVLNLWMSFLVIDEVWRASIDARNWHNHFVPWAAIHWWIAWVVASFGAVLLYFMSGNAAGKLIATVIYFGGHIAYARLLMPIVERIAELQQAQATQVRIA